MQAMKADNERLKRALLQAIPWIGHSRNGPDWATQEAKKANQDMADTAFREAIDCIDQCNLNAVEVEKEDQKIKVINAEHEVYRGIVEQTKDILQAYANRQGHDKCWWNPEVLKSLLNLYGIELVDPALPPIEEFKLGCKLYTDELYEQNKQPG